MTAAIDEDLDLSDLDLLDDPDRHIFCTHCKRPGPGVNVALCGRRALSQGNPIYPWESIGADTCVDCAAMFDAEVDCPRCGE